MRFKEIRFFTDNISIQKKFYTEILGFGLLDEDETSFSVKIGWSKLIFQVSEKPHYYHFCFLIPSNQLTDALNWVSQRVYVLDIESGNKIARFESWNADSFYFYDASGNLLECIVRYDLNNEKSEIFENSSFLGINEIPLPTNNILEFNTILEEKINSKFWKGDLERFGTNGNQEGLFLIPNYNVKKEWFPTRRIIFPEKLQAKVEIHQKEYLITFENEILEIKKTLDL